MSITIRLYLRVDEEGIHLQSSGEPKKLNVTEKRLAEGLMKLIRGYFEVAAEELNNNGAANRATDAIVNGANGGAGKLIVMPTGTEASPGEGATAPTDDGTPQP